MAMVTRYTNCHVLRGDSLVRDDLWVSDGVILDPRKFFWSSRQLPDKVVDCQDKIIVPGFIETQVNGGFGLDFSSDFDRLQEGLAMFRREIVKYGVTGFCPTIITSPAEEYPRLLPHLGKKRGSKTEGAAVLGAHVEGPFISKEKNGAHPIPYIRSECLRTEEELVEFFGSLENISIVTLAPELPGSEDMIRTLTRNNVVCSLGHSVSDITSAEGAVNAGACFITHLFNAMMPFHHRDPGIIGLLSSNRLRHPCYYGLIADGLHTHPAALRIAHRTHPSGAVLVTDAMAAMGLGDGDHVIGTQRVTVLGKRAVITGSEGTLAGSVVTMETCIRHFMKNSRCSLVDAVNCATLHPAQLLRCTALYGTLDPGSAADFVIIDTDVNVLGTFIGGDCVYASDSLRGFEP